MDKAGLLAVLDKEYGGEFKSGSVYSGNIAALIRSNTKNLKVITLVDSMVTIEQQVRNVVAHEIVSVTDEWFKKNTGKTAAEILKLIKELVKVAGIKTQ